MTKVRWSSQGRISETTRFQANEDSNVADAAPATMMKGSQTTREETLGVEVMDLESMESASGELPAMMPAGMWAREAQLRWIAESEPKSMSLSGMSSVASIASERDESPEPPPLILEGLEDVSTEEEPERMRLIDPSGFEQGSSIERRETRELTPTKTIPGIKVVAETKQQVMQRLEITVPEDQEREVRAVTRASKRSAGERSPPTATTPTKSQTTGESSKPPRVSLYEKAYRKQGSFMLANPDPRATSREDQRRMKTAYPPSPAYSEARKQEERHIQARAMIEAKDIPSWVVLMSKRMRASPEEEHPYIPHKGKMSDQMPGRTDS